MERRAALKHMFGAASAGFLKNMKVRTKIFGGFATILVMLVAVSGIGYFNFVTVGHEVDELSEQVGAVTIISHMEAEFLKLRGR